MKTGIELIAEERQEQIGKHKWDEEHDSEHREGQLAIAASFAINPVESPSLLDVGYGGWEEFEEKICNKSYKDRLIIAGALLAAEIDRLNITLKEEE